MQEYSNNPTYPDGDAYDPSYTPPKTTTIKCADCGEEEEFIDDGVSVDCMPDGCLVEDGKWICSDCTIKRGLLD